MNESFRLHTPTLLLVLGCITFITTILIIIAALFSETSKELKLWARGNIFICFGFLIGGFSGLPDYIHAVLSYALMGLGNGFVYGGLKTFVGQRFSWYTIAGIALAGGILPGYYLYIEPSLHGRLLISSGYFGILNIVCGAALIRPSYAKEKGAIWLACFGFFIMGLALLGRAGFLIWYEKMNTFISSQVEAVTVLFTISMQIWISFTLIIMVMNRYAKEMSRLSMTDNLTGVLNRNGLNKFGGRMLKRAEQKKIPMAVFVFDADHFKKINDQYGHLFGDEILRLLVQISKNILRTNDLISRFGGEEFILIIDSVNQKESLIIAERLCRFVASSDFQVKETKISCTVSVGVSCTDTANTFDLNTLIDLADKALYQAKQAGRNRVCLSQ